MNLKHLDALLAANPRVLEAVQTLSPEDQRWLWHALTQDDRDERTRLRDQVIDMGCALVDARELLSGASAPAGYRWAWYAPGGNGLRWEWQPEEDASGAVDSMRSWMSMAWGKASWPTLDDVRRAVFYRLVPVAWLDVVDDRVVVFRHPAAEALYPEMW